MPHIETTIIKLEEGFWQANVERDTNFYKKCLTDNSLVITSYGIINKQQVLESLLHAPIDYLSFTLDSKHVEKLSDDTALLTYLATYDAKINGKQATFVAYCSTVYIKNGDNWQAALHQETPKQ